MKSLFITLLLGLLLAGGLLYRTRATAVLARWQPRTAVPVQEALRPEARTAVFGRPTLPAVRLTPSQPTLQPTR